MNALIQVQKPKGELTTASMKLQSAHEAEEQRNREIGRQMKAATRHQPTFTRSLPHARGR